MARITWTENCSINFNFERAISCLEFNLTYFPEAWDNPEQELYDVIEDQLNNDNVPVEIIDWIAKQMRQKFPGVQMEMELD